MDPAEIRSELEGARLYCDLVRVKWPSADSIIWFPLPECKGDAWSVTCELSGVTPSVPDQELASVLSKTIFLSSLRVKLLYLGQKHFNVGPSLPSCPDGFDCIKWPGPCCKVRKLWISPTYSAQKATELFINEVRDLWREECLILHGFPLSVDFSLYVLYVLGHLFNKVGLVYPEGPTTTFLFYDFRKWDMSYERLRAQLCSMMNKNELHNLFISSESQKCSFYESKFYSSCVHTHCIYSKKHVLDILNNIETAESNQTDDKGFVVAETEIPTKGEVSNDSQRYCKCSSCISGRVVGTSISKSLILCSRVRDELEQLSLYVNEIQPSQYAGDVVWFFSEPCPVLEMVRKSGKSTNFNPVEISKFCLKQLLSAQRKLCEMLKTCLQMTDENIREGSCLSLDLDQTVITCMKNYPWSKLPLEVKTLDFGIELWMNLEDHAEYRNETLKRIISALKDTWTNECLELRGFPLLSEFSASIVFLVAQMFEKVGFYHTPSGRNAIIFFNFQHPSNSIQEHLEKALTDCAFVISLIPLRSLFGGKFYEMIRNSNNLSLKKHCLHMLKVLSVKKHL